ncbi:hypothetical protein ACSQ67_020278 [Phaseolus vulgaris]
METQYEEQERDDSIPHSSSEDEEEEIENDVTFEELQKARSNGAHVFFQKPKEDRKLKRTNKNRCCVFSSLTELLQCIPSRKLYVIHDLNLFVVHLTVKGLTLNSDFIILVEQALKKELKKDKDLKRIGEIEERISWIDKQMKSDSMKNIDTEILAKHKKKEREAAKQGKSPFYLKKYADTLFHCLQLINISHLENLKHLLRRGGEGMLQRTTDTCLIADLVMWNKFSSFEIPS